MLDFLSKFFYVVQGKQKELLALIGVFLIVSFLETFGTGMVGPFIAVAIHPDLIDNNKWLNLLYRELHFHSANSFLIAIGLLVIVLFYAKSYLNFHAQRYVFDFGFRQQGEIASRLMKAYLAAPYSYHLNKNSATLIRNIISETDRFTLGFMTPLLTSIANVVVILTMILLLIACSISAVVIIGGLLLISFYLFHRFKERITRWGKEGGEARTEMVRIINHSLGGIKETHIIGCASYFENQMQSQIDTVATSSSSALSFSNLPRYVIEACLITFLIFFTFLFLAISKGNSQNLTSVLGIFALASIRLLPATGNLVTSANGIKYNAYSLDTLYLELRELEEINGQHITNLSSPVNTQLFNDRQTFPFKNKVVIEDIVYRYPNSERNAIEKVSIMIEKGHSIGLIGKSGAGKTTLIDVILGLLKPQYGDIKIDDISIYTNLRYWQNMIGYVPQSIFLIDDTLEKNIAFGVPDCLIDRNRLNQAIEAAQLSELVAQLPNGVDTTVGERGVLLSGGQKQRVGIARALYHEREILVFDEATAALDNETESLVTEAIKSLSGIKTMIIIAHRLSTIEHCDCIYMMEQGHVVKSGSYREVVLSK